MLWFPLQTSHCPSDRLAAAAQHRLLQRGLLGCRGCDGFEWLAASHTHHRHHYAGMHERSHRNEGRLVHTSRLYMQRLDHHFHLGEGGCGMAVSFFGDHQRLAARWKRILHSIACDVMRYCSDPPSHVVPKHSFTFQIAYAVSHSGADFQISEYFAQH